MKQIIIGLIVITVLSSLNSLGIGDGEKLIPDEAIRLRILANSNSKYDQDIKKEVSKSVQSNLYSLLGNTNNIDEAREKIKEDIPSIKNTVNNVLTSKKYPLGYTVDFGIHYFPDKKYKGIKYDSGYYESLLVTLGSGKGDNWWCVLFPPLCLLEAKESSDVEYKFFVKELIDKIFK